MSSYHQTLEVRFEPCGHVSSLTVWLIVDAEERPDLLARARDGTLHSFRCEDCEQAFGQVDVPLVFFRQDATLPIIFTPARNTSAEEDAAHQQALLLRLHNSLGERWRNSWVTPLSTVSHEMLPVVLSGIPGAEDLHLLLQTWQAADLLIRTSTWDAARAIVKDAPGLLEPIADVIMARIVTVKETEDARRMVAEDRILLQECRTEGIDKTFDARAGKPRVPEDIGGYLDQLAVAIRQLMTSSSIDQAREIVESNQDLLLSERSLTVLDQVLESPRLGGEDRNVAQSWVGFLKRCLALGLEETFRHEQAFADALGSEPDGRHAMALIRASEAYKSSGQERPQRIEDGISLCQGVLDSLDQSRHPVGWAMAQDLLGEGYRQRTRGNPAENLERAIGCYDRALEVLESEAHPTQWGTVQHNLARACLQRRIGDRGDNVEKAVRHFKQALEVRGRDDEPLAWAGSKIGLADALMERIQGDVAEAQDAAIRYYREVLEVVGEDSEYRSEAWNGLGIAYRSRVAGERADNIEQAIACFEEALTVVSREGMAWSWAIRQTNLGNALQARQRGDRRESLKRAAEHYAQALEVFTRTDWPEHWATVHNNLTATYLTLGDLGASTGDRALQHARKVLEVWTRDSNPEHWAVAEFNLGTALMLGVEGDERVREALGHYARALEVLTREEYPGRWAGVQDARGVALMRLTGGEVLEHQEEAIVCFENALKVCRPETYPRDFLRIASRLGELYLSRNQWQRAGEWFVASIETERTLLEVAYTETGREQIVGTGWQLHANLAYCSLRIGRRDDALAQLERGKARLLVEKLGWTDFVISHLEERARDDVQGQRRWLRQLMAEMHLPPQTPGRRTDAELGELMRGARRGLHDVLRAADPVRAARLSDEPQAAEILKHVPEGAVLVLPLITSQGGAVFVLPHGAEEVDETHVVEIERLSTQVLSELFLGTDTRPGWFKAYGEWKIKRSISRWTRAIEQALDEAWSLFLEATARKLRSLGASAGTHVVIVPQGFLNMLPLHAARGAIDGEVCDLLEDYVVSYEPNLQALAACRHRLLSPDRGRGRAVAVIDPDKTLPFAHVESAAVGSLFTDGRYTALTGALARKDEVLTLACGAGYLHFSCHGVHDWSDVHRSGLVLAKGDRLSLTDIISPKLDLAATRLVVLSACETGLIKLTGAPEEYIGLPAGFLEAGAPGVLATLWEVEDVSAAILVARFFRGLLKAGSSPAALAPATALAKAQRWLRQAPAEDLLEELEAWFSGTEHAEILSNPAIDSALERLRAVGEDGPPPFASPLFWAPFFFVGG